jgi:hypothetical protein
MQAHNIWVTENAVIHLERSEKSAIYIDEASGSMLWACVTCGFFNSVDSNSQNNSIRFVYENRLCALRVDFLDNCEF